MIFGDFLKYQDQTFYARGTFLDQNFVDPFFILVKETFQFFRSGSFTNQEKT